MGYVHVPGEWNINVWHLIKEKEHPHSTAATNKAKMAISFILCSGISSI